MLCAIQQKYYEAAKKPVSLTYMLKGLGHRYRP